MKLGIDWTTVKSSNFEPLPEGDYIVAITGVDTKPTRAGTGTILKIEHTVTNGAYEGRKIWNNLNIENPNPVAENIGRSQLKGLIIAVGLTLETFDTDQLNGKFLIAHIEVEADTGWGEQSKIRYYKAATTKSVSAVAKVTPQEADIPF